MHTHELLSACVPTRHEKRRMARARGYKNEHPIYKECSDPERSGRRNCLDALLMYIDYALVHHPDAALAIAQMIDTRVVAGLARSAESLPVDDLVLAVQPETERETLDVIQALGRSMRQLALGGTMDVADLLREFGEGERSLRKGRIRIEAAFRREAVGA